VAKWLKLYATYTFSTSPNLCHRTTLLNTDVPNYHWNLLDCSDMSQQFDRGRHLVVIYYICNIKYSMLKIAGNHLQWIR